MEINRTAKLVYEDGKCCMLDVAQLQNFCDSSQVVAVHLATVLLVVDSLQAGRFCGKCVAGK